MHKIDIILLFPKLNKIQAYLGNDTLIIDFDFKNMDGELQHIISHDSKGHLLEGEKEYKLHLPSDIPASVFWSIIVYDAVTHLIINSGQPWPSVFSSNKNLVYNNDNSVDVWFSPNPVNEKNNNWIKIEPGKRWYMILRLYYPLESWFNKKWQPGAIEELI